MQSTPDIARLARRRAAMKIGLLTHTAVYIVVNAALWLLHLWSGRPATGLPMIGWGLGLAIHAGVVALSLLAGDWHGRLVEREMQRLERR